MSSVYASDEIDHKRLELLYGRTGIQTRHTVVPDYDLSLKKRELFSHDTHLFPQPGLEQRMELYHKYATPLATAAAAKVMDECKQTTGGKITHLITVSCTGMSAPGLDLSLMEQLGLPPDTHRTSVNFMGCYAAVHALKMADAICNSQPDAVVLVVCVELCTLHFQREASYDNQTANAIFADGAAACVVAGNQYQTHETTLNIEGFYSEVFPQAKSDMAWKLSSTGFLMTLSSYIPQVVESNIIALVNRALNKYQLTQSQINFWAIHPGGRKILDAVQQQLSLTNADLHYAQQVLSRYGNMSSATLLFVLKEMMHTKQEGKVFGIAFGPGLTMETLLLHLTNRHAV